MKGFLFDALMLLVGCSFWVISAVMIAGLFFIGIWMVYQLAEFANVRALSLLLVAIVWMALTVAMIRFAMDFWETYC